MTVLDPSLALRTVTVRHPCGSQARITPHGAQVVSWINRGRERLFVSPQAAVQEGQAIRGGVPIIFPQFGAHGTGPRHGFARVLEWTHVADASTADRARFVLGDSEYSLGLWPHCFRAELDVIVQEDRLSTALAISNCGEQAFEFSAALHTYLRVSDIGRITIAGLQGLEYLDATRDGRREIQQEATLGFAGEIDRIYCGSGARTLELEDGGNALRICSEGFIDTVVWNPGAELAASMADLGEGNHIGFVCVEPANVATRVRLAPGAAWRGTQVLACIEA